MFPLIVAGSVLLAAVLLIALFLVGYVVLKAAHTRPGGAPRHGHTRMERIVLGILTRTIRAGLRAGIRLGPMVMLTVTGRKSGLPRSNPVDLWIDGDRRYLVATHDDTAAWIRNLRAAGEGAVALGRKRWTFTASQLPEAQAGEVLMRVLGPRMRRPVAGFVLRQTIGVPPDAPRAAFVAAAATHPVFQLTMTSAMSTRARTLPTALIAVGLVVAAAHLVLGLGGVLGATAWISGVVLGLLVAGVGNHIRIFGRG